ncbi:MAG: hypothetical protein QG610_969 [Euryarchaeota archaeon]|jgi:hypothetical protein|nr:hypothetical protein [Euryarchaeota archaeon]
MGNKSFTLNEYPVSEITGQYLRLELALRNILESKV